MGYRKEYVHRCMMDGQMTCNFMSYLLTVFQSYQGDGKVILKNYVKWNHIYSWKEFSLQLDWNTRQLGWQASIQPTELTWPRHMAVHF